jgi:hypothetical protein
MEAGAEYCQVACENVVILYKIFVTHVLEGRYDESI